MTITEIDPGFLLKVDEEELPIVEIREDYVALEPSQKEERETLRGWVTSAKWLQRSLLRRRNILRAIGRLLIRRQATFFTEMGEIVPIDIQELASLLNVHESTAWRAVASKTLACPRGLIPLRQFFSESAASKPLKELLHRLILSD